MKRILFCCAMNSIRSPMAAAILQHKLGLQDNVEKDGITVSSAGIEEGILDGFVISVMRERDIDLINYNPKSIAYLAMQPWDIIIAFTDKAYEVAQGTASRTGAEVEKWNVSDPSVFEGTRTQKMEQYRLICDEIEQLIQNKFGDMWK